MSGILLQIFLLLGFVLVLVAIIRRARRLRDSEPREPVRIMGPLVREPRDVVVTPPAPRQEPPAKPEQKPEPSVPVDPLHDDVCRLIGYMSFCCGKGVCYDEITADSLREAARLSNPRQLDAFFHHLATTRPDLWVERARFDEELIGNTVLYSIKGYPAFLREPELLAVRQSMPSDPP